MVASFRRATLAAAQPQFETNFSTTADALAHITPWPACALAGLPPKPRVSVLGGSSSAHSCLALPQGGRYSELLQLELDQQHQPFSVQNLAHGATDSIWNSLARPFDGKFNRIDRCRQ